MKKQAKMGALLRFGRKIGLKPLGKGVEKGLKKSYEGEVPFLLAPLNWGAKKIFGAKKVNKAVYENFQKPLAALDIGTGQILQKGLGKITKRGKHTFADKRVLQMKKAKGASSGGKEYYIPSGLAPVKKISAFALPTLGAMKAEELLKGKQTMDNRIIKEADLKKTAEMLDGLNKERNILKKEAKATELLYKQAELGQIKMPATFAEYQEKVAELLGKNLEVVEEAIKIASSSENELGGLDTQTRVGSDPRTAFQQSILD